MRRVSNFILVGFVVIWILGTCLCSLSVWKGHEICDWRRALRFEIKISLRSAYGINEFDSFIELNMYTVAVISLLQCKKFVRK
jgi:hypothetical protein